MKKFSSGLFALVVLSALGVSAYAYDMDGGWGLGDSDVTGFGRGYSNGSTGWDWIPVNDQGVQDLADHGDINRNYVDNVIRDARYDWTGGWNNTYNNSGTTIQTQNGYDQNGNQYWAVSETSSQGSGGYVASDQGWFSVYDGTHQYNYWNDGTPLPGPDGCNVYNGAGQSDCG